MNLLDNKENIPEEIKEYLEESIRLINPNNKLLGFKYLYDASLLCILDPTKIFLKTKQLYGEIAQFYEVDFKAVDRSIRNFIKNSKNVDDFSAFFEYTGFGSKLTKPTNTNVTYMIALGYENFLKNTK